MEYLHTMVRVGDLDAALDFWCDKLGLVEVRRLDNEKGRYTLIFLAAPNDAERSKETRSPQLELTYNWDEQQLSAEGATSGISPTVWMTSMRFASA